MVIFRWLFLFSSTEATLIVISRSNERSWLLLNRGIHTPRSRLGIALGRVGFEYFWKSGAKGKAVLP